MAQISINYVEFNVKNIDRSKAFYETLGWTFVDFGPTYCEFNSGSIKGGFYQVEDIKAQGGPLVILYGQYLEETLEALKAAGAEITMPITDFPGGKRFHFKDLDGYELAVWSE